MNQLILNVMQSKGHTPYLQIGPYTCYNVLGGRDPATILTIDNRPQIRRCFLSLIFETRNNNGPKAFLEVTPQFSDKRKKASDQFRACFPNGGDDIHVRLINFNALLNNGNEPNQADFDNWISNIYTHINELIFGTLTTPNANWPRMKNRPGNNWQQVRNIIAMIP